MHYSAFSGVPRARIAASVERAIDGRESDNKSERRVGSLRLFGLAESQRNRDLCVLGPALRGRYMYMYMFTVM